jgi:hypothetical protein
VDTEDDGAGEFFDPNASIGPGGGRGTGLVIGMSGPTGLVDDDEDGRPIVGNTRGVIVVFPGPLRNGVRLSGGRTGIEVGSGFARVGGGTTGVTGRTWPPPGGVAGMIDGAFAIGGEAGVTDGAGGFSSTIA